MTDTASPKPAWPAMSLVQATALLTAPGSLLEVVDAEIDGRPQKIWKNGPPTLIHTFLAGRAYGDRTFLVYGEERATFEAFARATLALAADLQARGVRPGDRVAVAMRNLPEWPVAFFAAALVGAVVTPLNAWWSGAELAYGLKDSGSVVALLDIERLERIGAALTDLPDLRHVLVSRGEPATADPRIARLETIIGESATWAALPPGDMPAVPLAPEDAATIFYTSGTTGSPKGALGTHRNAGYSVMAGVFSLSRSHLRRGETPPALDPAAPQKSGLVSIPFFHTTGCNAVLIPALVTGQKLVCQRRFDAEEALSLVQRERITMIGGVPTVAIQILQHPRRGDYDLSSLETVAYGGAAAPTDLVRQIEQATPAKAGSGWGMTETSATHTHHLGEDYLNRPDSCGPVLPVGRIKVVDADGRDLPVGEVGELLAYGPNVVREYWNKPEATAETFVDGWVRTGDLARIDEEGFCFIVDRAKDIIIRGGENIYCQEIEAVLFEHPAVAEAALVAKPDAVMGEVPIAFISLAPGETVDPATLRTLVASRFAAFKVPTEIIITPDPLPRNAAGKVVKPELKTWLAARG
ncbi:class I adenylate-forming enzyme family protein [Brevundimonas sp. NIBR11]|uniref:class I adenylate-forming enzyme family protein n=1 Tax=Brevundimonas sp. NIBR11 TaxID=3015999 RepID=UPI0022F053C7|nr:class I adenylate-forming enzyme family protein [Brevundimonas sp. NIBR11]WGM31554.1 Long-chain-fatty-acid--CoA ligase [Brevundimonas sp. NIBR11]